MYSVSIKTYGIDNTKSWLSKLDPKIQLEIQKNLMQLAQPIVQEAKRLAPVKTGALRQSIKARLSGWLNVQVQDGVNYGVYQELGFYHPISGRWIQNPFLFPAMQIKFPEVLKNTKKLVYDLTKGLNRSKR